MSLIVIDGVECQMELKHLWLCRAPGFPKESIDVCSKHRCRMIESKERIKASAL